MTPRLSICIPTYNRAAYIGETLRSALVQQTDEVEIVVCDNASTDTTEAIVAEAFAGRANVRYFRWDRNMGADRNFLKVIEQASGDYCWFMGSDDIVEPGAVAHLLATLDRVGRVTGISLNRHAYAVDLSARILERPVAGGRFPGDELFTDASRTFVALGEYFGYLPGQVVDRRRWNEVVEKTDLEPYHNAYVHVYVIGRMLQANPRWLYVSRPCAGWRSGNDSFLSEGRLKRIAIDVVGLGKITRDLFGTSSEPYRSMARSVAGVHVFYAVLGAKVHGVSAGFLWRVIRMCVPAYWRTSVFWLRTLPMILTPRPLLLLLRALYRPTLKKARLARLH